ncbi:MAG: AAA family ATPase [Candidatus Didemnitutus sp.]|nr:AAA family ATPase [Candidatus Didemnitutus sp.]
MLTDWLNITRVKVEGAERLYPNGIDWHLTPGVNAIVGGTGLGKTTLVYATQFAIFGKLIVEGDRIEKDFFKDRLTKRTGATLTKNPPCVHVEFKIGATEFVIERNLLTGALVTATCNGAALKSTQLEQTLATSVGLATDFEGALRLQEHLFFFGEGRYLLAWQNLVQHELVNLLMSDHASYALLAELWEKVESADSDARNISAQAHRFEKDLKDLKKLTEKPTAALARRSAENQRVMNKKELDDGLAAVRKRLAADTRHEEDLAKRIAAAHARFHQQLSTVEAQQGTDMDEAVLAAALADPTVASVRRALADFYRAPDERGCPCCGRTGLDLAVTEFAAVAAANARNGSCVVCSKALPAERAKGGVAGAAGSHEANQRAEALQALLFEREQTRSRLAALREEEARITAAVAQAQEDELESMRKNPASVAHSMEIAIKQMREREKQARERCKKHMVTLKKELAKTNAVFSKISEDIAEAFKKYAKLYLDEPCDVAFLGEGDVPGKRGPQVKAPHSAFYPVISGETRPSAQALSDAQRSFVDLAFRMAVVEVWHKQTHKTVTLFVETPEGAVDIAYMERVAKMLRTFGEQGHTMVITTNLNNDIFLPEVMASRAKADRSSHVLNLLAEGSPRPVQKAQQSRFDRILKLVADRAQAK